MPDLEAHVPQAIEQHFGDRLAPGGLLVRQEEQEIDVRTRRQQAAAVAAGRDHGHALSLRTDLQRVKFTGGELEKDADDLVLHAAEPLGTVPPVAVLEQQILGARPGLRERRFQALSHGSAQLAAGVRGGERLEVGDDCRAVDQFDGARGALGIEHHARAGGVVTVPEWGEAESDNQTPGPRR